MTGFNRLILFTVVQEKGKGGKKKGSSFQTVSALHRVNYFSFIQIFKQFLLL